MSKRLYEEKRNRQTYVFEIENYWCKIKKGSRQRRTYLGTKDPNTGALVPKKTKNAKSIPSASKTFGSIYFLNKLSENIGLKKILEDIYPEESHLILSLAYFKILRKEAYYLYPYWHNESYLSKETKKDSIELSNILKTFGSDEKSVEVFFEDWIKHNKVNGAIMFDITSLSSYGSGNNFLEKGYNRDGELLDQINLGIISKKFSKNTGHFPVAYRIYPGSITDVTTLKNIAMFVKSYSLKAEIFVMDKGFFSQKNIQDMTLNGLIYLVPMSFTTNKSKSIVSQCYSEIFNPDKVFDFNSEVYSHCTKKVMMENIECVAHVFLDKILRSSQESRLMKKIIEIETRFEKKDFKSVDEALSFFDGSYKSKKRFFKISSKSLRLKRENEEIKKESKRFGFMILLTNQMNMSAREVLGLYRSKDRVEKVFNSLKNDLNERRNRVHSIESLRGSMFINFISLILISLIDHTMRDKKLYKKMTKIELYKTLERLKVYKMANNQNFLGEVSKKQKDIFLAFGLKLPTL